MYRWVTSGKIKSYSTPGNHKRILIKDLKIWLEENQIPTKINELENKKRTKILIVDDDLGVYASEYCNGFFVKNIIVLLKTTEISMDFIV